MPPSHLLRGQRGRFGGVAVALSEERQSTKAGERGAVGEERLGPLFDSIAGDDVAVLHDRRIPRSRANIDHLAVIPAGVWVIDAKRYKGRPSLKVEGGALRPRVEKLVVGRRDCTKLADGVLRQVELVSGVVGDVPVTGALCFVEADWPLFGGALPPLLHRQIDHNDTLRQWPHERAQSCRPRAPSGGVCVDLASVGARKAIRSPGATSSHRQPIIRASPQPMSDTAPNTPLPRAGSDEPASAARSVPAWAAAAFVMFFTRAFLFSTWVSRGPDVKELLGINTVQFGLVTAAYPVGGFLAVTFAHGLVARFGSRAVGIGFYTTAGAALALLGPAVTGGHRVLTVVLLVALGGPIAILDFVGNYEGTRVDTVARRSVLSFIHGAFGIGMLSAAALTGVVSAAGVDVASQFVAVAALTLVASVTACLFLPNHPRVAVSAEQRAHRRRQARAVWRERRSLLIALVGFTFVMVEMAASSWLPIALTTSGFSQADAAYALSVFWVVATVGRLLGGFLVDAIGRSATVLVSALLAIVGLVVFMVAGVAALPAWSYVGIVAWGAGMACGFPMSVSAMSDDPQLAGARVNMIITIVYVSTLTVGPVLGAVGQAFGIYLAFTIPVALLAVSALVSPVTRPSLAPVAPAPG